MTKFANLYLDFSFYLAWILGENKRALVDASKAIREKWKYLKNKFKNTFLLFLHKIFYFSAEMLLIYFNVFQTHNHDISC